MADVSQLTASTSQNSNGAGGGGILSRLVLDLRGSRFVIERETLMNLPESVLLCLFPNGLVLSRQSQGGGPPGFHHQPGQDGNGEDEDEEEVYMVEFDPACLSYVLSFFRSAQEAFYGTSTLPGRFRSSSADPNLSDIDLSSGNLPGGPAGGNPLLSKQAIIVLREELEYFAIPSKTGLSLKQQRDQGLRTDLPPLVPIDYSLPTAHTDLATLEAAYDPDPKQETTNLVTGAPTEKLLELKTKAGQALLERRHIFTALQRNVNKENNLAEQHLIDMLCMSGFERSDTWGFRAVEPARCCITSIALVLLKTGIIHAGDAKGQEAFAAASGEGAGADGQAPQYVDGPNGMKIDQNQLATAQKLLLFWRKPARKCWWDGVDVVIPADQETDAAAAAVAAGHATPTLGGEAGEKTGDRVPGSEASPNAGMTQSEIELLKSGKGRKVRVWARRVWTLELSLV